jgi:long-subunit acyl-CoA synthetase (AMP-forming)
VSGGGYPRQDSFGRRWFGSTGKKVAPQVVENAIELSPCVAQACAIGDRQRYTTVLVAPDAAVVGEPWERARSRIRRCAP